MYYNKILRVWIVDALDYFLVSALLGSILASCLKNYLSEKNAMERLKNSIIKKSEPVIESDRTSPGSKEIRIQKVYKLALGSRGGQFQFEDVTIDYEFSNEVFNLAQEIKAVVERLASFLKQRELKGVAKIFFKNGRLLLELLLYKCKIDISYQLLVNEVNTQVIVITATAGGAAGFTVSWFSAGAALVAPPLLISSLLIRSVAQQIVNYRDYSAFKKLINKMLQDDELKETIRAFFVEEVAPSTTDIRMKPWGLDKNPLPEFIFDSEQTFEQFMQERMKEELGFAESIKSRVKEEFGLVENPTPEQLKKIIERKIKRKPKGKTVYFKDFIKKVAKDPGDIIDAEIIEKATELKIKNKEL